MAQQVVKTSKQFTLSLNDFWKGLIVAILSPIVPILMESLNAHTWVFDWNVIGTTALSAAVAYLLKNFLSTSTTVITGVPAPGNTTTVVIPPKEAGTEVKPTIKETPTK